MVLDRWGNRFVARWVRGWLVRRVKAQGELWVMGAVGSVGGDRCRKFGEGSGGGCGARVSASWVWNFSKVKGLIMGS
ncbi:hypothetical protein V6N11_032113 [Hibiscus sabdariffa]|uniref:Uncharacterized protein n=1 Tax=Hibiscus sabdariffa TaxID=183260 RepID=A0ABR2T0E3_9ROSI